MNSPLVSIITVTLNADRYIEQAIQSVIAQEYPNFEHIVVDGGSSDNTIRIAEKYSREHQLRLLKGKDKGPPEAVNKGLRVANGEIVGILAADDLLFPWTTSLIVDAFRRNPEADIVYGDMAIMPMGRKYASVSFDPPQSNLEAHLAFGPISTPPIFWKKRVTDDLGGFDESLLIATDYDFCIRAAQRFKFLKIPELLACYRYRKESVSLRDSSNLRKDRARINTKYFGGKQRISIYLLAYEISWTIHCASELLKALKGETPNRSKSWGILRDHEAIGRLRLFREIALSPLLYTNAAFERRISHGFIRAERLLGIATNSARINK